jgi:hypothetical protein
LWIGYACLVGAYYFANTWTPKIVAAASGNDSLGVTIGVIANAGGILGCFIFSALAIKFRSRPLLVWALGAGAIVVALFLGILTTAGIAGFYAVAPDIYTARARATGIGPPEMGPKSVLDRISQLEPSLILAIDGYRWDRRTSPGPTIWRGSVSSSRLTCRWSCCPT